MAVNFTQFASPQISDKVHIAFTVLDPFYGFTGGLLKIGQVK